MGAKLIDGKAIAAEIRQALKVEIDQLRKQGIVQVGSSISRNGSPLLKRTYAPSSGHVLRLVFVRK